MSRKHKGPTQPSVESQSLRSKIKSFRKSLRGAMVVAFDKSFFDLTGETSMKRALSNGKNLQAAFVAARHAVAEAERGHPIVDVPFVEEDE